MEWLLIVVFLVFIGGLTVVTVHALRHAAQSSQSKSSIKPTR